MTTEASNASSIPAKLNLSTLWHSAIYNYGLQYSRFVLPLMVMPYLSRILGPDAYGQVFMSISFGIMLSLGIEFGFYLSATREIAKHLDDENRVATTLANVLSAKLILIVVASAVAVIASMYVARFQQNPAFAYAGLAYAIAYGMSPMWYYRAIEKMRMQTGLEIGGQFVAILLVFILVRVPNDALLVPIFQAAGAALAAGLGYAALYRNVPFLRPTLTGGINAIQSGWTVFLFCSFCTLYSSAGVFLVGVLLPPSQVAFFGLAEKLFSAITSSIFAPFEITIFPRMNYLLANAPDKALKLAKTGLALLLGASLIITSGALVAAPFAVRMLFGMNFEPAAYILQLFSLALPVIAINQILGMQCMLPLRMDRALNLIICAGGICNIAFGFLIVPAYGAPAMAIARLVAEALVTSAMTLYLWGQRDRLIEKLSGVT
jgi:PST family polysaccharide transporter